MRLQTSIYLLQKDINATVDMRLQDKHFLCKLGMESKKACCSALLLFCIFLLY
jgi:hypothetical protein